MKVMIDCAKNFIKCINEKYNSLWLILFCNNLATHISNVFKAIFVAGKLFMYYFLSNIIESSQSIDARHGRSM